MTSLMSSLKQEAAAAKAGLRLLARACDPLFERCRSLATQKRLLCRWYGYGYGYRTGSDPLDNDKDSGLPPEASLQLMDGLRSLVAALGREDAEDVGVDRVRGRPASSPGWLGGVGIVAGADSARAEMRRDGNSVGGINDVGWARHWGAGMATRPAAVTAADRPTGGEEGECKGNRDRRHTGNLVSLRAVGIALVAAQRLRRLAALRAVARAAEATMTFALGDSGAASSQAHCGGAKNSGTGPNSNGQIRMQPWEQNGPRRRTAHGDVIPFGTPGGGGGTGGGSGGVAMLCDSHVLPLSSPTALIEGPAFPLLLPSPNAATASSSPLSSPATVRGSAERWLGVLRILVSHGLGGEERAGAGSTRCAAELDRSPTLLQVLADGQTGHWRRLEERGLVSLPVRLRSCGGGGGGGGEEGGRGRCDNNAEGIGFGRRGFCRVAASRYAR